MPLEKAPGELRHAQWSDIDLEASEWRFIVTKTDTPHIVPLSRQAVEILRELHPVTGGVMFSRVPELRGEIGL